MPRRRTRLATIRCVLLQIDLDTIRFPFHETSALFVQMGSENFREKKILPFWKRKKNCIEFQARYTRRVSIYRILIVI